MDDVIINRVANSPIVTIDLEDFYTEGQRVAIDLKDNLEGGFLLREKPFREYVKATDWENYRDKHVAVHCSEDVIIPKWAYMLVATRLSGVARTIIFGDLQALERKLFSLRIDRLDAEQYRDKKVVIKGCGKIEIPESAFLEISSKLAPYVGSLMYGEPCSTVPVYKRVGERKIK